MLDTMTHNHQHRGRALFTVTVGRENATWQSRVRSSSSSRHLEEEEEWGRGDVMTLNVSSIIGTMELRLRVRRWAWPRHIHTTKA
jgi:hypothetical protein